MTSEPAQVTFHDWLHTTTGRTFSRWQKLLMLMAVLLVAGIGLACIGLLDAAPIRGRSPSLLQHGATIRTILAAVITVAAGFVVATLVAGKVRPDAGIFCVALGLLVFRFQGGSAKFILLVAGGREGLVLMAAELAVLWGLLLLAFAVVRGLMRAGTLPDERAADHCRLDEESIDQKLLCMLTVATVMTVGMMILCQSAAPGQAIWAVFLSAIAAAWCAFRFIPVAPGVWYWSGPLFAGVVGYLYTWKFGWQTAEIGVPRAMLAALARAAPLDYASVGVAGAMLGYWIGRRQKVLRDEQHEADAASGSHASTG